MKKKTMAVVLCLAMVCGILSGCMYTNNEVTFNKDGSGYMKVGMYYSEEFLAQMGDINEASGVDANIASDGMLKKTIDGKPYLGEEFTQTFANIDMLCNRVNNEGEDGYSGAAKFNIYSEIKNGVEYAVIEINIHDEAQFIEYYGLASQADGGTPTDAEMEEMMDMIKMELSFKFPGKIIENNGDKEMFKVSEDGTKLDVNLRAKAKEQKVKIVAILNTEVGKEPVKELTASKSYDNRFKDVATDAWFAKNLANVYNLGIMNGKTDTSFDPKGNLMNYEAVAMACRLHSIYVGDGETFAKSTEAGAKWYTPYLEYAAKTGILFEDEFGNYIDSEATRSDMAYIFANALPGNCYAAVNNVTEIPDMDSSYPYYNSIMRLYKAGILTGASEDGAFNPDGLVTRAEAAAIISRLAVPASRVIPKA